jgi:hypothetical protein
MKLKIIFKNLSEIFSQSTLFALPKIFESKRVFFKIFWFIYFIGASIITFWQITKVFNLYFTYEVSTQIKSVFEQPMPFPTISFCPNDPNSKAFDNKSLSEDILEACWDFDGNDCRINFGNYFESFESGGSGTCYRYNSGRNMSGHSIPIMNSNSGGLSDNIYIAFKTGFSIIFTIHDSLTIPKFETENLHTVGYSFVEKNSFAYLSVHKTVEKRLEFPYNDCYKDLSN